MDWRGCCNLRRVARVGGSASAGICGEPACAWKTAVVDRFHELAAETAVSGTLGRALANRLRARLGARLRRDRAKRVLRTMLKSSRVPFLFQRSRRATRLRALGRRFSFAVLAEADVMRRVLQASRIRSLAGKFLPPDSSEWIKRRGCLPAVSPDRRDGKLAHLDGLNLSRAWMLEGIASALPNNDPRRRRYRSCCRRTCRCRVFVRLPASITRAATGSAVSPSISSRAAAFRTRRQPVSESCVSTRYTADLSQ